MFVGLSSTMRIVAISARHLPARHRAPDLGGEARTIELALLQDRGDGAVEPLMIVRGDALGGHLDDRDPRRVFALAERLYHVEAVHRWHNQVEHDEPRQLCTRQLDRLL